VLVEDLEERQELGASSLVSATVTPSFLYSSRPNAAATPRLIASTSSDVTPGSDADLRRSHRDVPREARADRELHAEASVRPARKRKAREGAALRVGPERRLELGSADDRVVERSNAAGGLRSEGEVRALRISLIELGIERSGLVLPDLGVGSAIVGVGVGVGRDDLVREGQRRRHHARERHGSGERPRGHGHTASPRSTVSVSHSA
jgi:hypothetical protein